MLNPISTKADRLREIDVLLKDTLFQHFYCLASVENIEPQKSTLFFLRFCSRDFWAMRAVKWAALSNVDQIFENLKCYY